jgi:DNA-directed RNA polymerase subunit RPC12/RpoP
VEKRCSKCSREVNETIHTTTTYKVDYFERDMTKDKSTIHCYECEKKYEKELLRKK